ncbi:MAG TPA: glucose 1-dehydrogenase [Polyangiaceae bacterium]|nr:glucose 1-dehydrogenase [Polyangiaceae bacterium]
MGKLSGKVAVVTGASKGIGAGIATALGAAGAAVIVNYASDAAGAERVVAEIVRQDGRAIAVQADVASAADIQRLFAAAEREFGAPSIVVNNAGVFRFDPLEAILPGEFHRQFDINVLGPLLVTQEAVKHFDERGGSVINVSSVVSTNSSPGSAVYAATKAALDSLTRVLARELGPRNIRVNAINPGLTETEGARGLGVVGSDFARQKIAETPLGRIAQPDDIAPVAVFLASDDAHWVTGECLRVAGGLT